MLGTRLVEYMMSRKPETFLFESNFRRSILKSPSNISKLFSLINFSERGFRYSSLKSLCCIHGCLYMHPTTIFLEFFWIISIKTDSNFLFNKSLTLVLYTVNCFSDIQQHSSICWFSWYMFNIKIFQLNICCCSLSFLKSCFWYANYLKVIFFDFDVRLSYSSKWNGNKLMFKWKKEKGLPMSLKVEFRSLVVKYLVMLFSELIALMKFSVLEIAGLAIWVNLTCFLMTVCLNSLSFIVNIIDRCLNTHWEKTIHLLQVSLHQCFQIVVYT